MRQMDGLAGNPPLGVKGMLDSLDSALALLTGFDYPRLETAVELATRLKAFGRRQFDFFDKGFGAGSEYQLEESEIYPPPVVLARIVRQVGEDAEIILRAAEQRRIPQLRDTLELADRLACRALLAARPALRDPSSSEETATDYTVLTYFQKSAEIRVLPYAPIALIGIPLTALNEARDLLAIPHELGHFVYFNRRINHALETANRHYADGTKYEDWQQEVFADVLGSLVAGPLMAYDFQELAKRYGRVQFVADDGAGHPPPFLRPLIYTEALRLTKKKEWAALADALDERWTNYLFRLWRANTNHDYAASIEELYGLIETEANAANFPYSESERYFKWLKKARDYVSVSEDGKRLKPAEAVKELVALAYHKLADVRTEDWSGKPAEMQRALENDEGDLDRWFKESLSTPPNAPPELKRIEKEKIWDDWVETEEFWQGKTLDRMIADAGTMLPLQFGVGSDPTDIGNQTTNPVRAMGQAFVPTWQLLWLASGWVTDPAEPPGHPP
jgi:hypothetical protein